MSSVDPTVTSQQQSNALSKPSLLSNVHEKDGSGANHVIDSKNDSSSEKEGRNSSDDEGGLVIDLDNENDVDKVNKETKPYIASQSINNGSGVPTTNSNNNSSNNESLCTNKQATSNEKVHGSNKSTCNSSTKATGSLVHAAGKNGKMKSKKSSKSNKQHPTNNNSLPHLSNSRSSSPGAPFTNSLETAPISSISSKHVLGFEGKPVLLSAANSPDDSCGKKSKTKSKSHHKKHGRHGDKSNLSHVTGKSDSSGDKVKTKWKHSSSMQTNPSTTNMATFSTTSGSHILPVHLPGNSSPLAAVANKSSPILHRSASPNTQTQSTHSSPNPSRFHLSAQFGRTPTRTALAANATGSGARSTHACNDKEQSLSEPTHGSGSQIQVNRKKHRKGQPSPPSQNVVSSSTFSYTTESENDQTQAHISQQSSSNGAKRERMSNYVTSSTADQPSSSKKLKMDSGNIYYTESACDIGESSSGYVSTESRSSVAYNNTSLVRTDIGNTKTSLAGSKFISGGIVTTSPPVFAPSSVFAQTISRYTPSRVGPHVTSVAPSLPQTSSVWCTSGAQCSEKTRTDYNTVSQRSVGTLTSTSDIGVMTEPDALGPCEPGTSVHLDGIVWHETDTGVLVVNVTWRNRSYVGTLLDSTKQNWAPPRLSDNDMDMDFRLKNGRGKRTRGGITELGRKSRNRGANQQVPDDVKGSPSAAAKRRNKNSESEATNPENDRSVTKRARIAPPRVSNSSTQLLNERSCSNGGSESSTCSSPVFIECPHPKCSKKYKHINGLKYHQSHAHKDFIEEDCKDVKEDGDCDHTNSPLEVAEKTFDTDPICWEEEAPTKSFSSVAITTASSTSAMQLEGTPSSESLTTVSTCEDSHDENILQSQRSINTSKSFFAFSAPPFNINTTTSMGRNGGETPRHAHRIQATHTNVQDHESAVAVENLLKLQDSGDMTLPGLSTPYSQDCPHPTLTLGSHVDSSIISVSNQPHHGFTEARFSSARTYPSNSLYSTPATVSDHNERPSIRVASFVTESLPTSVGPCDEDSCSVSHKLGPGEPRGSSPQVSNLPSYDSEPVPDLLHVPRSRHSPPKENYITTISNQPVYSSSHKAKGKTVPIPFDPNQSMASGASFSRSSSPGNTSTTTKKQKRKKKSDLKHGNLEGDKPSTDVTHIMKLENSTSSEESSIPPPSSSNSLHPSMNAPSSSIGTTYMSSHKTQNIALKPNNESSMIITSHAIPVKSEPGLRLPPQHFGGRKVPGIVLPATTPQHHSSNNVIVTGTFHPHPDPHKPQTAVSAQAQDRLKAGRNTPPISNNLKNKNNNNPPPGGHSGTSNRTAPLITTKPSSQPPQVNPLQPEGVVPSDQGPDGNSSKRHLEPKSRPPGIVNSQEFLQMNKIQDAFESTIDSQYISAYASKASQHKAVTLVHDPPRSEKIAILPPNELHQTEARPLLPSSEEQHQHRESSFDNRPRVPVDVPIEPSVAAPSRKVGGESLYANNQAAYMSQMQQIYPLQYGYSPQIPMDPAYMQMLNPAIRQYVQEMQKQQHLLQQQQVQMTQQENDKKSLRNEISGKDTPKLEVPHKSVPRSPADPDKTASWNHQHPKRLSTGTQSPFYNQNAREKILPTNQPSKTWHHSSPPGHHTSCKPSLPGTPVSNSVSSRANPTAIGVVTAQPSGSPPKTEFMERGRPTVKEEVRPVARKPVTSPVRGNRSPEKAKETHPSSYRPPPGSAHLPYHYPAVLSQLSYRGIPQYVPGFQPGYMYTHAPPGAALLQPQQHWPPGTQPPVMGKQSPLLKGSKDQPQEGVRSPSREDLSRGRQDVKVTSLPMSYVASKDQKSREVPEMMSRRLSASPDPKVVAAQSTPRNPAMVATGAEHRPPSPPTQRHHHTHHHIHEGYPPLLPINIPNQHLR